MNASEIRQHGINNTIAITEMIGAKKDGDEESYLFWETVYKILINKTS